MASNETRPDGQALSHSSKQEQGRRKHARGPENTQQARGPSLHAHANLKNRHRTDTSARAHCAHTVVTAPTGTHPAPCVFSLVFSLSLPLRSLLVSSLLLDHRLSLGALSSHRLFSAARLGVFFARRTPDAVRPHAPPRPLSASLHVHPHFPSLRPPPRSRAHPPHHSLPPSIHPSALLHPPPVPRIHPPSPPLPPPSLSSPCAPRPALRPALCGPRPRPHTHHHGERGGGRKRMWPRTVRTVIV